MSVGLSLATPKYMNDSLRLPSLVFSEREEMSTSLPQKVFFSVFIHQQGIRDGGMIMPGLLE